MTHSQLLETESAPDRVAELQSWIAGAVERLEAPNSEDGFAVEILDQCLVRLDVLGSAAGLDGYGDLEALSSILSEHYWKLRDDNRGLTAEDLLVLFDWTTAAGMYLESPNEPEVIDALLSPLPEEQQALVREVLSAEVSSGSDATPSGGDELSCRDPQGTTPTFVQSEAEPNAGDSSASAPNVLVFPVDENDCISASSEEPAQDAREEYGADCFDGDTPASVELLAPDMVDDGAEADSVLAVLADELGEISPELSSLAEVIAGTDEAAAELAASSYLELVGRLSAVSEGLGLDGLSHITEFKIKPDMDVDDVITAAMHFDACLIRFYREMAVRAPSAGVKEVFENLLVMEEHEQLELSKTMLELG